MRYAYLIPPLETGGPIVELLVAGERVTPLRHVAYVRGDPNGYAAYRLVRHYLRGR